MTSTIKPICYNGPVDGSRVSKTLRKILVADDDLGCRKVLANFLKSIGFAVIEAANGYEAVQGAKREKPDLIILDIMMPGMGGDDASLVLQEDPRTQNIPIIFLSSLQTRGQEKARGGEIEGRIILAKPVNTKILSDKIKGILG